MRTASEVVLTAEEERVLTRLSRLNTSSVRLGRRARIVLLAWQGLVFGNNRMDIVVR